VTSFAIAAPEFVSAAATDLAKIGSTLGAANAAAVAPTTRVLAAGADEVSAGIAALFGAHAEAYQALSAQAEVFHTQFVQLMNAGASSYAAMEAIKVQQTLLNVINAPTEALVGRGLIGNGADGGPGQNGEAGGLLIGNGGKGGTSTTARAGGYNGRAGGNGGWVSGNGGHGGNGANFMGYSAIGGQGGASRLVGNGGDGGNGANGGHGGAGGSLGLLYGTAGRRGSTWVGRGPMRAWPPARTPVWRSKGATSRR
jgi:PE family